MTAVKVFTKDQIDWAVAKMRAFHEMKRKALKADTGLSDVAIDILIDGLEEQFRREFQLDG